jgi:hypothetical protein
LLFFDGCFLMMFQSHSAARSKKVDIQQRITFAGLCIRAFDNAQIDIHAGEVHDGVWCSPFALVLALDFLPKRQRPYRVLKVRLRDWFGIEQVSGF